MSAAHAADRLDAAVKLLLEGNSPHMVVADIAARYGCGKRQGRNVVAKAYQQIQKDVADVGLDRKALTAQTVHCLQAGMAQALERGQINCVIGVSRELRELLGLGPHP
jgi:predicted methyltransferase MtxX (methanogen marker protein 4)